MSTGPFFMCLFFLRLLFFPLAAIISFLYCFYDLTGLLECVIHRAVVLNDEIAVSLEKFHISFRIAIGKGNKYPSEDFITLPQFMFFYVSYVRCA